MARLAIFIDGGYLDALGKQVNRRVSHELLCQEVNRLVAARTAEPMDLLRAYYYDCLPYQSSKPKSDEAERYARKRRFFDALRRIPRFEVREGRLALVGMDGQGKPIFQQKRTDMLLGLDVARLSATKQITHAAIVSGDSDFLPAIDLASQEGVAIWLFHGPPSTYAKELWLRADERCEMDSAFMQRIERIRE